MVVFIHSGCLFFLNLRSLNFKEGTLQSLYDEKTDD